MIDPGILRRDAEAAVASLPPLVAMAAPGTRAPGPGLHGRRRPGQGGNFWQYRPAAPGDPFGSIDWRRSARTRWPLVRQNEWEAPQDVWIWVDASQSMRFRSPDGPTPKLDRAALLALAVAILLVRGGERVALADGGRQAAVAGPRQLDRLADRLVRQQADGEYGLPPSEFGRGQGGRALLFGDFLGDWQELLAGLRRLPGQVSGGCLVQILDPHEETFPYRGRVRFESAGGSIRHRVDAAETLADSYRAALADRRRELRAFARRAGWHFRSHRTDELVSALLVWLAGVIRDAR